MSFARHCALLLLLVGSSSMFAKSLAQEMSNAVDGRRSSARFIVHMRVPMRAEAELSKVSGLLRGASATGWEVLVKVDGRSLRFDGPVWMDKITRSDSFLAVDRYPAIGFDSDVFSDAVLHGGGPLHGKLTLRGMTRPISFELQPATCAQPGRDCDILVHGSISRKAFGMNAYRAMVKDNVDFHIRVRLRPATPAS
jgi:polyisoprenoid-binding protein YceI